jgi:hypothetical protein
MSAIMGNSGGSPAIEFNDKIVSMQINIFFIVAVFLESII